MQSGQQYRAEIDFRKTWKLSPNEQTKNNLLLLFKIASSLIRTMLP